jgi:hypothetical protein
LEDLLLFPLLIRNGVRRPYRLDKIVTAFTTRLA